LILKNTLISKKDNLDRFYTSNELAKKCIQYDRDICKDVEFYLEPSAGKGSFLNHLDKEFLAYDIDKSLKDDRIIKKDFFSVLLFPSKITCCVGNPPFGTCSTLAIKFFNHCAFNDHTKYIAFILPKTFRKISVQNKLSLDFSILKDFEIEKDDSYFDCNDEMIYVPVCFQIWERKKRMVQKIPKNIYFEKVKKENADIAIRRVGGNAGKINEDIQNQNENSNYFLKIIHPRFFEIYDLIDFDIVRNNTSGIRSISLNELIILLSENERKLK